LTAPPPPGSQEAVQPPSTIPRPRPRRPTAAQFYARRGWHVKRQVCDLGDEQRVCRLARETGREQPGRERAEDRCEPRPVDRDTQQLNLDFTWSLVVSVLTPLAVGETPSTVSSTASSASGVAVGGHDLPAADRTAA
jgi:hypothetical protein